MASIPKELSEVKRASAYHRWGRRRKRCACGVMTLKRARTRGRSNEHQESCEFYKPSRIARKAKAAA
jgi:hypothetical protein